MVDKRKSRLTPTEGRVVELVCEGLTNPEIGARLHVAESTIRWHLKNVFRKLGVRTRTELVGRWYAQSGSGAPPSSWMAAVRDTPHL